ncbi:MAG TPA: squalene/phytoene synthase family protein, partial [Stellaceae bacterium]|nr:squalene/phytoene synthase family protein [Stellaceae bacterium]
MLDARERDLADPSPADIAALEDYADATSGSLVRLALAVLGATDPWACQAAREVGVGYALAGLMRAMPYHAAAGRRYIPDDVCAAVGLDPADYAASRPTAALHAATAAIAAAARAHLAAARRRATPRTARPALLPAIVAERFLLRLARVDHNPFAAELRVPDAMQSWRLAAAMLTGRV